MRFKVQGFRVQRFIGLRVQGSKVQRLKEVYTIFLSLNL
jgi:hypothetical protein